MERINERVRRITEKKGMSYAELGRRINRNTSSVHAMFKRKTLQVSLLEKTCKALEYNFFRELAKKHQYKEPVIGENYKEKYEGLNTELDLLKQTLTELQAAYKESELKLQQSEEQNTVLNAKLEVYKDVVEKFGKLS